MSDFTLHVQNDNPTQRWLSVATRHHDGSHWVTVDDGWRTATTVAGPPHSPST